MQPTTTDAIRILVTTPVSFYEAEGEITGWDVSDEPTGEVQPTQSAIDAKLVELQAEYDNAQYARDRQYPAIGDQLDALFHAGVFPAEMAATLQAVKDAHPKA
jgi:hypothetical protein